MAKAIRGKFPTSFGVSSPTGHVVMAFPNDERAELDCEALLAGGFSENDVTHYTKEAVVTEFETSNEQVSIPVQIGQDVAKIAEYLELAKEDCGFLVVHAAEDDRSKKAIATVQPYGLKFAEKYNRLTIEELA